MPVGDYPILEVIVRQLSWHGFTAYGGVLTDLDFNRFVERHVTAGRLFEFEQRKHELLPRNG